MCAVASRVFDIQRFSIHDGPGVRTTVFLMGCPLRCAWCHNPESWDHGPRSHGGRALTVDEVLREVLRDRDYYDGDDGGLTVSGGEPLLHPGFVAELLRAAKEAGIHTCVQTCGHVTRRAFEQVLPFVDLVQFDLKHMSSETHRALTGIPNDTILANARRLTARGARVQFRVPIIPGSNDDRANIDATAGFLLELGCSEVRLVPYRPYYAEKDRLLGLPLRPLLSAAQADASTARARDWLAVRGLAVAIDA